MSKVKNITPEERENALALIRKMGLEETEQQINYYVRMQRDSKKHREEKEKSPENNSNSSIGKIFGWGIFIAIFLMMKMCGGCNGCESEDENVIYESETWKCAACKKTFTYYKDKYGEHDSWHYWRDDKICSNCYGFRKSVNDALKKNNSPYADYSY